MGPALLAHVRSRRLAVVCGISENDNEMGKIWGKNPRFRRRRHEQMISLGDSDIEAIFRTVTMGIRTVRVNKWSFTLMGAEYTDTVLWPHK